LPELSWPLAFDAGTPGLLLLFIALATPERMKSGIEGAGGAVEDARTIDVDEAPTPPDAVAPAEPELAPAAKPLTPAMAAPAATPPALTSAKTVDPTSPEMILFAMKGISAMARA
jgi:hypothetical protein